MSKHISYLIVLLVLLLGVCAISRLFYPKEILADVMETDLRRYSVGNGDIVIWFRDAETGVECYILRSMWGRAWDAVGAISCVK